MKHPFVEEIKSGMLTENGNIYVCNCGGEALVFEFTEDDEFHEVDFCYVSMWARYALNFSWLYRFRSIWHIIRYGHPYTDTICLSKTQMKKINECLTKELNK